MNAWSLPERAFQYLHRRLLASDAVLELGSGEGTARLVEAFGRVHTVEHDERWLGKVEDAHYIHAPIVDGWYDPEALKAELPSSYACIVVDGPPGRIGRHGLMRHLDLFGHVPLLVDDVHRAPERELAAMLAMEWNTDWSVHLLQDGRAFATIGWGDRA